MSPCYFLRIVLLLCCCLLLTARHAIAQEEIDTPPPTQEQTSEEPLVTSPSDSIQQSESATEDIQDETDKLLDLQKQIDQDSAVRIHELKDRLNKMMNRHLMKRLENSSADSSGTEAKQDDSQPDVQIPPEVTNNSDTEPVNHTETPSPGKVKTKQILARPVDQLNLADSLFQSTETQLALDIYTKLLSMEENHSDKLWIKFQIAACLRRMGKYDEARSHLRQITDSDSAEFPVPLARWWLEQLDAREKLVKSSQQLDVLIKAIEEEKFNE